MALIRPTPTPQGKANLPLLTAYWNTERKSYAIAYIPKALSTHPPESNYLGHWAMLISHLRDEAINLRLVCRACAHPLLRVYYLGGPIDPPRPGVKMNINAYNLIQRVLKTSAGYLYSNPTINLKRSFSRDEFLAFQAHFPNVRSLPRLVMSARPSPTDTFPLAIKLTLSYCNTNHISLSVFPNIKQIIFTNPDEHPPTLKDWDPLFMQLPVGSLLHLKQIEFVFTSAYGFFSHQGLESLIKSAPNLAVIIYSTDKRHITPQELSVLKADYPHIEFRNLAAYI